MNTHSAAQIASRDDAREEHRQGHCKDPRGSPCKSASASPQPVRSLAISQSHPNVAVNKAQQAGDSLLSQFSVNMHVPTACTNAINEPDDMTKEQLATSMLTLDTTQPSLNITHSTSMIDGKKAQSISADVSKSMDAGSLNISQIQSD